MTVTVVLLAKLGKGSAKCIRGSNDHTNIRILQPGSEAQDRGDSRTLSIFVYTHYIPYTIYSILYTILGSLCSYGLCFVGSLCFVVCEPQTMEEACSLMRAPAVAPI